MRKKTLRLSLSKETLRRLDEGWLKEAAGAATDTDCGYTYCSNCMSCPATACTQLQ